MVETLLSTAASKKIESNLSKPLLGAVYFGLIENDWSFGGTPEIECDAGPVKVREKWWHSGGYSVLSAPGSTTPLTSPRDMMDLFEKVTTTHLAKLVSWLESEVNVEPGCDPEQYPPPSLRVYALSSLYTNLVTLQNKWVKSAVLCVD